ncbi:ABC-type methionine transport system ATPase subunit [Peribacillus simplex]|nr:ABC-type methionine transport system ATPase subunit [Peribacillus simplex]
MIRLVNLLEHPSDGQVIVGGKDLTKLNPKELRAEKKKNRDDLSAFQFA